MSNGEVSLGQAFQFEVEKLARRKQVVFEYSESSNEQLRLETVDGVPCIVANRQGLLGLARLLVTMGAAQRFEGLCLRLRQNFDGDCDEVLRIRLEDRSGESAKETPVKVV